MRPCPLHCISALLLSERKPEILPKDPLALLCIAPRTFPFPQGLCLEREMRGRSSSSSSSSSKQGRSCRVGGSMEIDRVDKAKEEPHLSGAYIRSLVKHLTSTRTKDPLDGDGGDGGVGLVKNLNKNGECFSDQSNTQQQQPSTQPPQHKKQVRRRLHTSRPYQERLLNMAEARREIVTALKFHRASMKQQEAANNHDLQSSQAQPPQLEQSPPLQVSLGQEGKSKSRRNPRISPSSGTANPTATNFSNTYLETFSGLCCPPPVPYYWPVSTIAPPPPLYHENLNFTLPNQTLGLNLNLQDFSNLESTNLYRNPLSMYSSSSTSSSPSTCSSAAISIAAEEVAVGIPEEAVANSSFGAIMNGSLGGIGGGDVIGGGLHHAMDDEEIEEIRSLGEQHQMEWDDTINLVTSARWFKFLKTLEIGSEDGKATAHEDEDYDWYHPFDQVMEFPPWLINSNESSCLQQHFDDPNYSQDPTLSCMDIGEIEGMDMDGEWLA